jgi:uncharacterized protein
MSVPRCTVHAVRRQLLVTERTGVRLQAEAPETHRERVRGLLGRDGLGPGSAMLLERARSVHTVGMRFPLLVAFLDAELTVLEAARVPPGRVLLPRRRCRHVLECGTHHDLREGDRLLPIRG